MLYNSSAVFIDRQQLLVFVWGGGQVIAPFRLAKAMHEHHAAVTIDNKCCSVKKQMRRALLTEQ
jgi:hypothetical protein